MKKQRKEPTELVKVLMQRDNMSQEDVEFLVEMAREEVEDGVDPEDVLAEHFGLEPDYVFDLLGDMF
jgi:hypothetical protein